ncbi:hypothetical protein FDA09_09555 [Clostridium botulinum]|uniref:hypothetical protein n=1 Tax=Clostridium botulinum TaxID=1491 RepID=UPI0007735E3B|nr:hypothetical protein [Clostridium botulinum]MBN1042140.1 hypothetical protein [Clostridium botulinum]MBY6916195.1 hypothetical protein [Clostridium botulinum]NFG26287.1 hypothetical protein [Clostridium botulinum]NFH80475.1 hypothetical protein [Clostridium botulinum]NFH83444.1 hypothetical protein [Clostridium botulinum]
MKKFLFALITCLTIFKTNAYAIDLKSDLYKEGVFRVDSTSGNTATAKLMTPDSTTYLLIFDEKNNLKLIRRLDFKNETANLEKISNGSIISIIGNGEIYIDFKD